MTQSGDQEIDVLGEYLRSFPAIDTHDHLYPVEMLQQQVVTPDGPGMDLCGLWQTSYFPWTLPLPSRPPAQPFSQWWAQAKSAFPHGRALSSYHHLTRAIHDLYGVDFGRMDDDEANHLNEQVFCKYQSTSDWAREVVTERANIELVFIDPCWHYGELRYYYPFQILVLRIQQFLHGHSPAEFAHDPVVPGKHRISPYDLAGQWGMQIDDFDDYLDLMDRVVAEGKAMGAYTLKQAVAYLRTLHFARVPKARAAHAFGKPRGELNAAEIQDFEDFIMWRLAELSAKYDIPFQIHTGPGLLPHSHPMLLCNLIEANPATRFILFHGGVPWVSEIGMMAFKFPNVWLDANWMPILSQTMARRAFHEWLDMVPSNRIMWGCDSLTPEGLYGAAEITRDVLAQVLAERVQMGNIGRDDARDIGRQILRDNAWTMFPQLQKRLWKHTGKLPPAPFIAGMVASR